MFSLWSIACRVIENLNLCGKGGHSRLEVTEDVAVGAPRTNDITGRVRLLDEDPRVKGSWCEVLAHARHLRAARRCSFAKDKTGVALWERLGKALKDSYGRPPAAGDKYQPLRADDIAELPAGSPTVALLPNLPGRLAEAVKDHTRLIRELSDEDREMQSELRRRYDHFGGAPAEYPRLLNRAESEALWYFDKVGSEKSVVAILAVGRAKDQLQRKILAGVEKNFVWKRPEDVTPKEVH